MHKFSSRLGGKFLTALSGGTVVGHPHSLHACKTSLTQLRSHSLCTRCTLAICVERPLPTTDKRAAAVTFAGACCIQLKDITPLRHCAEHDSLWTIDYPRQATSRQNALATPPIASSDERGNDAAGKRASNCCSSYHRSRHCHLSATALAAAPRTSSNPQQSSPGLEQAATAKSEAHSARLLPALRQFWLLRTVKQITLDPADNRCCNHSARAHPSSCLFLHSSHATLHRTPLCPLRDLSRFWPPYLFNEFRCCECFHGSCCCFPCAVGRGCVGFDGSERRHLC